MTRDCDTWNLEDVAVQSNPTMPTTGGELWKAAKRCAEYLSNMHGNLGLDEPGINILELGAGLGYLGLNIARNLPRASTVCLTEQGSGGAMEWLQHNLDANSHLPHMHHVAAKECDWMNFEQGSTALHEAQASLEGGPSSSQQEDSRTSPGSGVASQLDDEGESRSQGKVEDLRYLLSKQWDFIVGSDLIYNHIGSMLLPRVIKALSRPHTITYYCHTKHRFDNLDLEFLEQLEGNGLRCEEVREPWMAAPSPSPPPLTELFPDMRIAVFKITVAAA